MIMVLSTGAFAASGFEFIFNVPFGLNINLLPQYNMYTTQESKNGTYYYSGNKVGFDVGASAQIGYMWQIKDNFGISLLGELGYSFDSFNASFDTAKRENPNDITGQIDAPDAQKLGSASFYTHNLKIGILPKFNIKAFSIGVGLGVIIPMAITQNWKDEAVKTLFKDASTKFMNPAGFYAKLTFDYSIFFTEKIAMNIGLYTGVDAIGSINTTINNTSLSQGAHSEAPLLSYDIGLQLGFRFGPKAFN
ncbi:hypothetical protein BFL38_04005 [Brachyspira hampsonii]|uniref:Outer membrane protein beta-barrel domain-containing protein n=1 Tax=Brachyspira hampsonii TaxID=1287055 RepID=A0A1E5NCU0_9SPIR|nr:hypothetical protein [Brachyspira hampsonii]OEJ13911.1 hypothetical protein BFL38_04005 [Brachyspira hampsonii]